MNLSIQAQSYSEMLDELKSSGRWGDYYLKDSDSFRLISNNIHVDSLVFICDSSLRVATLITLFIILHNSLY